MVELNQELIEKQELTLEQIDNLIALHKELKIHFLIIEDLIKRDQLLDAWAPCIADVIQSIEYQMQDNWNFDRDKFKHRYWYRIPGCTCPVMDNDDAWGTPYHIINNDCPFHGMKEQK